MMERRWPLGNDVTVVGYTQQVDVYGRLPLRDFVRHRGVLCWWTQATCTTGTDGTTTFRPHLLGRIAGYGCCCRRRRGLLVAHTGEHAETGNDRTASEPVWARLV